jgi:hypothetical protein
LCLQGAVGWVILAGVRGASRGERSSRLREQQVLRLRVRPARKRGEPEKQSGRSAQDDNKLQIANHQLPTNNRQPRTDNCNRNRLLTTAG